ncbi:TonB-dependent receptor [Rugamonas sp. CCM 8940]|uniref:TonB-dependent receptor n=1 Tax=Rugamonas sp. CCM 8940 TaxID=2765359 RepID=UPI001F24AFDE|nr:TonB-dependent receptor [Rugamonas sp. CCM 8940]
MAGTVMMAGQVRAEEQQVQRVEITGSSIKRIQVEGALPVQRLSQEAIARTGATNVAELIQALPAMQGFTIAAVAAGSDSGGAVNASIHNIGADYTLVLLDGRRLAPSRAGSAVNLNSIPMSAIERVEILTDGASALYGSDAIAGVINFILKKNYQGKSVEATYSSPTDSRAGQSHDFSLAYGFGNLEEDRFNVLATYRHDESAPVKATDRNFAKTAYIPFTSNGTNYIYDRTSVGTVPANVTVTFKDQTAIAFSPYLKANGNCPARNVISLSNDATTANCAFDFVSTVEIVPQNKRDSFFTKGTFKATDEIELYAELALSRLDLTARIAPVTAPFSIATSSAYYSKNVQPYLTPAQAANVAKVSGSYRAFDWGTRDSQTLTNSTHFVTGAKGEIGAWSFDSGLTWSRSKAEDRYVGGYVLDKEFRNMLATNAFDPFAPIGNQSDATKAKIANSVFHGTVREASTTLKGVDLHGSRELFSLPGGNSSLGLGADLREYSFKQNASDAANNGLIYNFDPAPAYDLTRKSYGAFAELLAPLTKELELSLAGRYDTFGKVDDGVLNRSIGEKQSSSTYKVSARWQPTKTTLLRGSYGTGFKAPGLLDLGQPLVNAGVTATSYKCPPLGQPALCKPGTSQYPVLEGGNENLRPEKSKQFSVGFRVEPSAAFSFGADLWDVKMTDAVSGVTEAQIFLDPVKFRSLFTTYTEPATGDTYYAIKKLSVNIGQTHNRGIDYDLVGRHRFDFGNLTANLSGTYLMKSEYTKAGSADEWTSSLNFFGTDDNVAFRHIVRAQATLDTGALSNSLTMNYRNGYTDAEAKVRNLATNLDDKKFRLQVPSHITFDWQGRYAFTKTAAVRVGVKNLLNREPPLSLRASSGHQVGFDPRYADPMLRTFYMTGNVQF